MGAVRGEVERVDDAAAGEGEALLAGEKGNLFDQAKGFGVDGGVGEQRGNVGDRHRAKADAAL